MRDGAKVQEFDRGDVPIRTIVEAMVGRSLERMFPPVPVPRDEVVLEVRGLSAPGGRFRDISFGVRKGEVFGIAGRVGAGRPELVRAITGADPIAAGEVLLHGKPVTPRSPIDAIRNGIVLVPEDRKLQGVVLDHSIAENIGYVNLAEIARGGWITSGRLNSFADGLIRQFGVKGRGSQNAGELSGGNQQKVVLAKWLARKPQVVVLDEPTRGIDVGARSSIYDLIMNLAKDGVAVVVVSSDLEEVLGVSNRILVMAQGKQAGILAAAALDPELADQPVGETVQPARRDPAATGDLGKVHITYVLGDGMVEHHALQLSPHTNAVLWWPDIDLLTRD